MVRPGLKPLLGLLLAGALAWLLFDNIEFYQETEHSGLSVDARRNPYLAAELFMRASGLEVSDVDSLARLDRLEGVGTLFFGDANQVQAPRQLERIMNWLDRGGNVIYAANSTVYEDDLLLAEFEVSVAWAELGEDASPQRSLSETMREFNRQLEQGKSRDDIARALGEHEVSLTRVGVGDDIGDLEAAFDNGRVLTHPYLAEAEELDGRRRPFSWSVSDYGVHMMQFEVGEGLLTIVSDPGIWTAYRIDAYDHAYLLWLLSSDTGEFAIVRSVVRDSLWRLAQKNAAELLIAAALLLLAWIWAAGHRFGRLLPREISRSRALGEHFSSVSHYLWHRRQGAYLIAPLRQRLLSRASSRLAEFARAEATQQYELLARRCGLEAAAVARAFEETDFSEAAFVDTVRLLKRIEQSL